VGAARLGGSRGMTGGEIIVRGSAGAEVGASARRGLIVVAGNVGQRAGHRMIAGSVIVLGLAGRGAGQWSKRGTVVVIGDVEVPATFRYACTYRPPHVRLVLTYLHTRRGVPVEERYITGRYRRYSGDLAELAKGEILQWTPE
jgi:formylmethanofuran dehydrogenase subunit C